MKKQNEKAEQLDIIELDDADIEDVNGGMFGPGICVLFIFWSVLKK